MMLVYRKGGPPRGPCPGPGPPHMSAVSILSGRQNKGLHYCMKVDEFTTFDLAIPGISEIVKLPRNGLLTEQH